MKKRRNLIILFALMVIAGAIFDASVAVRPVWPEGREGDPSPARPQPGDDPFHVEPLAETFDQRRVLFREWVLSQETSDGRGGVWTDIVKLQAGAEAINPASFQAALDFVNERQDPSDFYMTALIRMYYLYAGTGKLTTEQESAIEDAILNYKYWLDEPGTTYVEMWTENHQILRASAE